MAVWDPLRELERLRSEMDRIFQSVSPARTWSLGFLPGAAARQYPRVNVGQLADGFFVEALAPGVEPATLEVSVKDNVLTIAGDKPAPADARPEAFHRSERSAGRFLRTVELPAEVDAAKVSAAYTDGILRVTLPKAEAAKPKRIEISVA